MDIKEIREALDKLEGGALKHCDNDEDYHKFILADREFRIKSLDYCRFLLSEVERLEKENAALRDVVEAAKEFVRCDQSECDELFDMLVAATKKIKDEL